MNMLLRPIVVPLVGFLTSGVIAEEVQNIIIKTLPAQMRYDVTELELPPGQRVNLTFQNDDEMPHNICFFQPGTDVIAVANSQMEKPDEALKRNWIPVDARMWLHSKPVDPKQSDHLEFTVPEKPGVYPFVCTFPGHAAIMNGTLKVAKLGTRLADLKFRLYLGEWKALPKFPELKPHREGVIEDNLIQLKLDDYKNDFAVLFTGKLNVPKDGDYVFQLASDDGARVFVDGQKVVDNDGIHPASRIAEGKRKLKQGEHEYRLEYFQAGGEAELFAAWRGPGFSSTPLSKWVHPQWKEGGKPKRKKNENTGMPIVVGKEPVIYRNFIAGAGERGIAVGYPGGFNIAWSAGFFDLALVWRGAFIDAARHWNSRGGGYQPPLGFDVFRPSAEGGLPFAVNPKPDGEWPRLEKGRRAEGYQWKGYTLDRQRFPTFAYEWNGLKVTDRFDVSGEAVTGEGRLIRTIKLEGAIPPGAMFRIATGAAIRPAEGGFLVDGGKLPIEGVEHQNTFVIAADGAQPAGRNLIVPARAEIKITYSWPVMGIGRASK